jgi:hypothetical protein
MARFGPSALRSRFGQANPYGKAPEDLRRIVDNVRQLSLCCADHELQKAISLNAVMTTTLHLAYISSMHDKRHASA